MKRFLLSILVILGWAASAQAATTLALVNLCHSQCLAGRIFNVKITESGGTAYTGGSSPFTVTGGSSPFIVGQTVQATTSTCYVCVYTGQAAGTLTLNDTVNSVSTTLAVVATYAPTSVTGTTWYVGNGGVAPPELVWVSGSPVTSPQTGVARIEYDYAVVAHAGSGLTGCEISGGGVAFEWGPNYSVYNTNNVGNASVPVGFGIGGTSCCQTVSSGTPIAVAWSPVPGATGYDVYRSNAVNGGNPWAIISSNQSGTSFSDTGAAGTAQSPPAGNTTAASSDSNTGLSLGQAFATMHKACSVAQAGDVIVVSGFVSDSSQCVIPSGVCIKGGAGNQRSSILFSTFSSSAANVAYVLPSNADVSDLTFINHSSAEAGRCAGQGTGDTVCTNCNVYRCRFLGLWSGMWIGPGMGCDFTDCTFLAPHGANGGAGETNSCTNYTRCAFSNIVGYVFWAGGQASNIAAGYHLFRDCTWSASIDSSMGQQAASGGFYAMGLFSGATSGAVVGLVVVNGHFAGTPTQDLALSANCPTWLINTPYDAAPGITNPVTGTATTPTVSAVGTYQIDPLSIGNSASSGGAGGAMHIGF